MSATLFTPNKYHQSYRALIAAKYAKIDLETKPLSDAPTGEYPQNMAPYFKNDKCSLFGGNAIAYYVGNEQLKGGSEEHKVMQWVSWADRYILSSVGILVYPCMGVTEYDEAKAIEATAVLKEQLAYLEKFLTTRTFLVGERITQADITVFTTLLHIFEMIYDAKMRDEIAHVTRWFMTVSQQPEVQAVVGDVILCDVPVDPKSITPESVKDAKYEEELEAAREKEFNMNNWKGVYSNNNAEKVAMPWFWEKFDSSEYSIWLSEYLYNDELNMLFMSSNLVGGMFQRLEKMRNFSFGSVLICGENKNTTISGIWVWKSQNLMFEEKQDCQLDYECYKWTKLDSSSEETKKLVNKYFIAEEGVGGKVLYEQKVFK